MTRSNAAVEKSAVNKNAAAKTTTGKQAHQGLKPSVVGDGIGAPKGVPRYEARTEIEAAKLPRHEPKDVNVAVASGRAGTPVAPPVHEKRRALGRGLDSLLPSPNRAVPQPSSGIEPTHGPRVVAPLPSAEVVANGPTQAAGIAVPGVVTPIVVTPIVANPDSSIPHVVIPNIMASEQDSEKESSSQGLKPSVVHSEIGDEIGTSEDGPRYGATEPGAHENGLSGAPAMPAQAAFAVPTSAPPAPRNEVLWVPIDSIEKNPHQTRTDFKPEALNELAKSIKAQGIMQPLVVRLSVVSQSVVSQSVVSQSVASQNVVSQNVVVQNLAGENVVVQNVEGQDVTGQGVADQDIVDQSVVDQSVVDQSVVGQNVVGQEIVSRSGATQKQDARYVLILGERRLRAAGIAGLDTVPVIVRRVSEQQAAEMTLVENLQRQDLNCVEQAWAFAKMSQTFQMTQEEIGKRVGLSREAVANYMRLTSLPESVLSALVGGRLTYSHARALMPLKDNEQIWTLAQRAIEENLKVTELEALVKGIHVPHRFPAHDVQRGARWLDPNVKAAQRSIEEVLGMRVRIRDRNGRGRIVIEYNTIDDFDRLVETLKGR